MKILAFDIETAADKELCAKFLPPVEVKTGNTKDPAKIAEKEAAAEAKQLEQAALNPHVARVVSCHYAILLPDDGFSVRSLVDVDEPRLLRNIWTDLADAFGGADHGFTTFNGASFDVPFLMRRSLIVGVTPTVRIETHKYRVAEGFKNSNHVDVRRVLAETLPGNGSSDYAPGSLDYYGKLLLGEGKLEGVDGSQVGDLFAAGDFETIRKYGEHDAALTLRLFQKIDGFYVH